MKKKKERRYIKKQRLAVSALFHNQKRDNEPRYLSPWLSKIFDFAATVEFVGFVVGFYGILITCKGGIIYDSRVHG
ncbi:hypothetical protein ACQCVO_16355 [Bacillus infantis]|uniref:hypothetical protein n=1 Tax=Bacillus infantis TaxID=324767 RepID=UPI003CE9ADAB